MRRCQWVLLAAAAVAGGTVCSCVALDRGAGDSEQSGEAPASSLEALTRDGSSWAVTMDAARGAPSHLEGRSSTALAPGQSAADGTLAFLEANAALFKMKNPRRELASVRERSDALGMRHVRFQQVVDGIRVSGATTTAHFDASGALVTLDSEHVPDAQGVSVIPKLTAVDALELATATIGRGLGRFDARFAFHAPVNELVIFPTVNGPRLAYHTRHYLLAPKPSNPDIIIDANDGTVLRQYDDLQAEKGSGIPSQGATAFALEVAHGAAGDAGAPTDGGLGKGPYDGSFPGLEDGGTFPPVEIPSNVYGLVDLSRTAKGIRTFTYEYEPTAACMNDQAPGGCLDKFTNEWLMGKLVTSTSKDAWDDRTNKPGRGAAVDAHFFAGVVYDYFKTVHGRDSLDGKGLEIRSSVHLSTGFDNAFWNGFFMSYGDGSMFKTMTGGIDVVGHEMTHGVTSTESMLEYHDEPGALNESVSDIFGAFIEHFYKPDPTNNWYVGEALSKTIKGPLRKMDHPGMIDRTLGPQPTHVKEMRPPVATPTEQNDNGGVHTNSGVPNNAAYLMTMGGTNDYSKIVVKKGIGWSASEKLWYRTNTEYLQPTSNFAKAAQATLNAAKDLNFTAEEKAIVECAWIAVGVLGKTECDPIIGSASVDSGTDAATSSDGSAVDAAVNAATDAGNGGVSATPTATDAGCGCSVPGTAKGRPSWSAALTAIAGLVGIVALRARRRRRA
jgi:bacillolysin